MFAFYSCACIYMHNRCNLHRQGMHLLCKYKLLILDAINCSIILLSMSFHCSFTQQMLTLKASLFSEYTTQRWFCERFGCNVL